MSATHIEDAATPPTPVLWTRPDLEAALGLSRSGSFRLVRHPDFPKPVLLYGENSRRRWYRDEVLAFVEKTSR